MVEKSKTCFMAAWQEERVSITNEQLCCRHSWKLQTKSKTLVGEGAGDKNFSCKVFIKPRIIFGASSMNCMGKTKCGVKALTTDRAVILSSKKASGKRVATHIMVNRYWFPLLVLGNSPTQSLIMHLKGSPILGIRCIGAGQTFWLGFPAIWQVWQKWQCAATSDFNPGQVVTRLWKKKTVRRICVMADRTLLLNNRRIGRLCIALCLLFQPNLALKEKLFDHCQI